MSIPSLSCLDMSSSQHIQNKRFHPCFPGMIALIIYPIICLKSVNVRRQQVAILARSPREMSQTDRILPRYFLSRVHVSVRPRIFLYAKKLQKHSLRPITDRQRHHRQNGATRKAVHTFTPGGATYVTIHTNVTETQWMILLALQNPTLRESYPRCNGPAKRGNVCESFEKRLIRYRYRPLLVIIISVLYSR